MNEKSPMSDGTMKQDSVLHINVSGKTVYAAIKNLLINDYKLDRDGIVKALGEHTNGEIRSYMNGNNVRHFISEVIRETVKNLAEPIIRREAQAFLDRRVTVLKHSSVPITIEVRPEVESQKIPEVK